MSQQQPMFEGEPVKAIVLGLTGQAPQANKVKVYHRGDEVAMLVVGVVSKVTFTDQDDLLARLHTVKVAEAHVLDEGEAATLLAETRERDQRIMDKILGRTPLWEGDGPDPDTGEIR